MKYSYLNKYQDATYSTKVLNYPSKLKNFNNGLEPNMFLKLYNNFFNTKYFPISQPYFMDYINKNNIHNK